MKTDVKRTLQSQQKYYVKNVVVDDNIEISHRQHQQQQIIFTCKLKSYNLSVNTIF